MRFIVDADPGHDDLVAIAVARRSGHLSLITTVAGNAPLAETTANALVAADLVGFDGPVVSGAARPRARDAAFQPEVHGETGMAGAPRPPSTRGVAGTDAAAAIVEHADPETWIVATGPLTNVADALERDPGLAVRIAGITIMGGGVEAGGDPPVAEFNVRTDPEAAEVVLGSGARLVVCGLDLTTQVRYDDAWVGSIGHPYVRALLGHYLRHHRHVGVAGAPLHDPCAVLAVTHPHWFSFETPSATLSVARTVDAGAVLALVRDVLGGLEATTGPDQGRR